MLIPYYYQKDAINDFFKYTAENHGKYPLCVIPTAGGKSVVIAYIIKRMLEYKNTRILCVTHQKELIKQNYNELIENFDNDLFLDVGIYSAGLERRDTQNRIMFAGIQSVYNKAWHLGFFDLILVDEAHLIGPKKSSMYQTFFTEMEKINPKVVIGGFTATHFRMKEGLLTQGKGAIFDEIYHETTVRELIDPNDPRNRDNKQYLCNLISKNGINKADLSGVHTRYGEYIPKEMQNVFLKDDLVCKAVKEIKEYTTNRNKILVFCAGIDHAKEVLEKMKVQGLNATLIHSKQSKEINDQNIKDFKKGKIKYLLNIGILSTGFNEKAIDCIVLLFSTKSPGKYIQVVGRGTRLHPSKTDCLILDFGRNIERHGPIDKIEIKRNNKGEIEVGTMPMKECPKCQNLLPLATTICPTCGHEFPQKDKHDETASNADIISQWKKPEELEVHRVEYSRHYKDDKPVSLKVTYYVDGLMNYSTWVCIEHSGYARQKALQWLRQVTDQEINTVEEAIEKKDTFLEPKKIIVDFNSEYPTIAGYIYPSKEKLKKQREEEFTKDLMNLL